MQPVSESRQPLSTSDGSLELLPIEDEWPEPAQVVDAEGPENYQLATGPVAWARPTPLPEPEGERYTLAEADAAPKSRAPASPVRFEPPAEPYTMADAAETGPPPERHLPTEAEVARLLPEPPPPPPRFPLFSGIYTFPWRPSNLIVWLANGLNFSVLALIASGIVYLFEQGGHMLIGVPILLSGAGVVFAWAGMYLANCFLAVVEDTANGNDAVTWPKSGGLLDGLGKFFYVLWIVGCAVIATALVWIARGASISSEDLGWVVSLLPFLILFPVLILSALAADAWWMLLDGKIIWNFLKKPHALALVIVPPLVLLSLCVYWTAQLAQQASILLPFGIGFAWATFVLLYGRILGRAGWILTESGVRKKSRHKSKPRARTKQTRPASEAEPEPAEVNDSHDPR